MVDRPCLITCPGFVNLGYMSNPVMFSFTRKGGDEEGHGKNSWDGGLSRKRYPLVTFGRHQDSGYAFLCFHVFIDPTIPNTMWLIFVGLVLVLLVLLVVIEDGNFCVKLAKRLEGW